MLGSSVVDPGGQAELELTLPTALRPGAVWVAAVDRSVSPAMVSGAVELEVVRPVVEVTDFGAVCDGVHDDTPAIQASVGALTSGSVWRFPVNGQCTLSDGVILSNLSDIQVEGRGASITARAEMVPDMFLLRLPVHRQRADRSLHGELGHRV